MSSSSSRSGRSGNFHFIPLDEIKDATDDFNQSNVIEKCGEGEVYLSKINLGGQITQVAVKQFQLTSQEFFDNEIQIIPKIEHPNLVSHLGYCDESGQKILVYEYMEKGSLSDYIKERSSICLSWLQRLRICLDAARGLQHLHLETTENPKGIIHRSVTPYNILLDRDWAAKISNFGLSKLSVAGQLESTMITNLKGTSGYYAPEYLAYGAITRKIDVYALGVVLFQVLCNKMPWDRGDESYYGTDDEDLGIWALENVDARIKAEISDDPLMGFTSIIVQSLNKYPRKRPTMDDVVLELEKALRSQERDQHSTDGASSLDRKTETWSQVWKAQAKSVVMSSSSSSSSVSRGNCRFIPLDEINDATNNFSERNVLGKGGEGKVYLAKINLGGQITQVAVKHLKPNSQEFDSEILIISQIQHPNLVSLLGYCDESGQKILLYEFMEKGSLSDYLKNKSSSITLSWVQRLRICLDAARGLQHLHVPTDTNSKGIIHRDVKPDNILLGRDWVAKISDFGLFKLSSAGQKNSTMITLRKGTSGYFAPEYFEHGTVTRKIDVFAFGVVLFQVLCLKTPWDRGDESYYWKEDEDLGAWALQNVDAKIEAEISDESLKGYTAIIGKILRKDPRKRPTMDHVVLELEEVLKCQEREDEAKKA